MYVNSRWASTGTVGAIGSSYGAYSCRRDLNALRVLICIAFQIGRLIESSSLLLASMSASSIDMRHGRRRLRATLVHETHRSHADTREADADNARIDRGLLPTRVRRQRT